MSTLPFAHLHCHSHYSLLDGAGTIRGLLERAKALRMNALALTDHGNLHGAVKFYQTAKELGINPILGLEAYIAPGSRFHKESAGSTKEANFHLTLLARNAAGFRNLVKLSSAAFLEGFYFKPRIDKELLAAHREGLICLSGCVSSELNRTLLAGGEANLEKAVEIAAWYREAVRRRLLHRDPEQRPGNPADGHAGRRRDGPPAGHPPGGHQRRPLRPPRGRRGPGHPAVRQHGQVPHRHEPDADGDQRVLLRSPEEMYAAFPGLDEALRRTPGNRRQRQHRVGVGRAALPRLTPPARTGARLCRQESDILAPTLSRRSRVSKARQETPVIPRPADRLAGTGTELAADEVMARLERELEVINKLGFSNYFLIVWDFVRFAREQGIPATARGSGVGSLVSYGLHLSHVCPLDYDLLFERFLDESRREAPDIDIDFCQQRRGEVIQYVKQKYGEENVAQIGTFGTLAARAAIRDVGRALGLPIPRVDAIVALVPEELGITLKKALEKSDELKKAYDTDAEIRKLLDLAMGIEGLARNVGTHAAAVVIADRPLTEYVPLQHVQDKKEVITQWAMGDVERAGLLKMDFLGLRNLTILSKVVDLIEQTTGKRIDPYQFPRDDQETFALLCRGETKGVFQLESGGIRDLLQRMKPDHFRDVIATNALYRPGPLEGGMVDDYIQVKHGRKQAEYKHPVMKEILEETHGVMVYQEQVMRILNRLGGIQLANAYSCIKAISKKKLETIAKFREEFIEGRTGRAWRKRKRPSFSG